MVLEGAHMSETIRVRISKVALNKLSISKGISEVIRKYSINVNEDVLEEFLRERR